MLVAMFVAARVAAPRTATPRAREREASTRAAHGPHNSPGHLQRRKPPRFAQRSAACAWRSSLRGGRRHRGHGRRVHAPLTGDEHYLLHGARSATRSHINAYTRHTPAGGGRGGGGAADEGDAVGKRRRTSEAEGSEVEVGAATATRSAVPWKWCRERCVDQHDNGGAWGGQRRWQTTRGDAVDVGEWAGGRARAIACADEHASARVRACGEVERTDGKGGQRLWQRRQQQRARRRRKQGTQCGGRGRRVRAWCVDERVRACACARARVSVRPGAGRDGTVRKATVLWYDQRLQPSEVCKLVDCGSKRFSIEITMTGNLAEIVYRAARAEEKNL